MIDPTRYCVSGVTAVSAATSARPTASSQRVSPRLATAALTPGTRSSRWKRRTRADSSRASALGSPAHQYGVGRVRGELDRAALAGQGASRPLDRALDVLGGHVEVRDGAEHVLSDGEGEEDSLRPEARQRLLPRQPAAGRVQEDEVRLDLGEVDRKPRGDQTLGEPPRVRVIVGEALDVVVERVEARRGDDARLAHGAAEHVLQAAGLRRELGRGGEQRAERAAEALREAERDGVELACRSRPRARRSPPTAFRSRAPSRCTGARAPWPRRRPRGAARAARPARRRRCGCSRRRRSGSAARGGRPAG